jgi:hypothetical protein
MSAQRKPVLCRLKLHHEWAWFSTEDGEDYFHCAACGKVVVPERAQRKPLLCRLNLHQEWVPSVAADRDVYCYRCTDCGKERPLPPASLYAGTAVPLSPGSSAAARHAVDDTYWAPDPTGAHQLRLIRAGQWTPDVVTAGVLGSDAMSSPPTPLESRAAKPKSRSHQSEPAESLSGWPLFDWTGPATAPTRSTPSEWLPAGTYVFRSKWQTGSESWSWENPFGGPRPVWYSAVWTPSRPIFLIEDNGKRFTAVDSGTGYPAARRSRLRLHTQFGDGGLHIRATSNGAVIDVATRTRLASTYSVANQPPDRYAGDHTVVITVPNAIPMRLGVLILSYATRKKPWFEAPPIGGGG